MKKQQVDIKLLTSVRTYSNVLAEFVIFGSPATNKNSKVPTKSGALIGSKYAQQYSDLFSKQIERYKYMINGIPFDDADLLWVLKCYYSNENSDVSLDLIFDLLQHHGVITNDKTLRNYLALGSEFDKELPRVEFTILGKGNGR